MEALDIEKKRGQLVVKSNTLIRESQYNLSAQEQKLILYVVSKIKPNETSLQDFSFDLKDLCKVCGIQAHGQNYSDFKKIIHELQRKSFWLENDSVAMLCSWVTGAVIYKNDTMVSISLDEKLKPYLLHLRENFTSYELEYILGMRSKYAIRMYELLKSYAFVGKYTVKVEDLKSILQTAEYDIYNNFKVKVIDKAVNEINALTDLYIEYNQIRQMRKIVDLEFTIKRKDFVGQITAMSERGKRIDGKDGN